MFPRQPLGLALLLTMAACGSSADGNATSRVTRTDSAGIDIVTNGGLDDLPASAIDGPPTQEILSDETGGPPLFEVTAVLPMQDNGLAVGVNGTKTVLIYDAEGQVMRLSLIHI